MSTHAFVDESVRGRRYLVSAALVDPSDLTRLRKELRALLLPEQRELHFQKEKPQRRRRLADQIVATGATITVYTACCDNGDETARQRCLEQLARDLTTAGAHRLVLDGREGRDILDARTLRTVLGTQPSRGGLTYEHLDSTQEPLLWISDGLGGATAPEVIGDVALPAPSTRSSTAISCEQREARPPTVRTGTGLTSAAYGALAC
ncbi:MAG: hypothetical protein ACRDTF_16870 [Pseudonocardiaceae bacterium]